MNRIAQGLRWPRGTPLGAALVALTLTLPAGRAAAAPPRATGARAGVDAATAAARIWADDASLVYLENDEDVDAAGAAARWGYLFYSPARARARGYSVRDGRIVVAEDLPLGFAAPPLAGAWIDSDAALRAADAGVAARFRRDHGGRPSTLLLTRGAFEDGAPDQTTWTVVYAAADAPSLFVVVDAATGRVLRTWRG